MLPSPRHFHTTHHRTRDPWKTIRPNPSRRPSSPNGACPAWGPIRTSISLKWTGVGKEVSRIHLLTAGSSRGGAGLLLVRWHRGPSQGGCSPWRLSLLPFLLDPCGQRNPKEECDCFECQCGSLCQEWAGKLAQQVTDLA